MPDHRRSQKPYLRFAFAGKNSHSAYAPIDEYGRASVLPQQGKYALEMPARAPRKF